MLKPSFLVLNAPLAYAKACGEWSNLLTEASKTGLAEGDQTAAARFCFAVPSQGKGGTHDRLPKSEDYTMSDVAERVKKIVIEHLGVDADKVTEKAHFIDDLGADSLDTVELVMAFEEEFNVEIPDDAAEKIATVGDAVSFLSSKAA